MIPIIQTTQLCKKYGKAMCVKDLDLVVPEGAIYGFLGPNGAGKTTTMKMILQLVHPSSGAVSVFGKEMNHKNRLDILKDIGSLIESPSYYGHLTGRENLEIISLLKDVPKKEIDRVLRVVRLEQQKNKKVSQYSLGMKQRLGLACALLGNPKLLILDEPTNGLDPAGIQEMRDLICSFPKEYGMTVMVSSHLLSEIDQMATHVGIIDRGELVFQDSLSALHQSSSSTITLRTLDNDAALKLLADRAIACERRGPSLVLPMIQDDALASLIYMLCEAHIGILRVEEQTNTLEDIFIQFTGKAASL
ncbi:MAG: ABC transporter ATP-binding protein [Eubacteriales bacterium]